MKLITCLRKLMVNLIRRKQYVEIGFDDWLKNDHQLHKIAEKWFFSMTTLDPSCYYAMLLAIKQTLTELEWKLFSCIQRILEF